MVFCGAQLPIKQERACGVMSQFNSFHCSLPVVWHSQAIGLEVKAAEMKEPSQKLGKAPSAWAKVCMSMYYEDKTLMLI